MAASREKNFVSAVVCLRDCGEKTEKFLQLLRDELDEHFEQYEIVAVDDASRDDTAARVRAFAAEKMEKPLTLLHMSVRQGREACMNAGQDCAIGDFVFEFETAETPYEPGLIYEAYKTALTGSDIVSVGPEKLKASSKLFYALFNRSSRSAYPLSTDAFTLLSRRAVNRVHSQNSSLVYRKAAYAACGLKMNRLSFPGTLGGHAAGPDLAMDSLILYTDFGYRVSFAVTCVMFLLAVAELAYTLMIFAGGRFVEGWVTTMFVLTLGLAGLFAVLTIVVKYLSLLLRISFKKQEYLVESIEKFQK